MSRALYGKELEALVGIVKGYYEFVFELPDMAAKLLDGLKEYKQVPAIVGAVAFTLLFEYLYFTRASEVILGIALLVLPSVGIIVGALVGHLLGVTIVLIFLVIPFLTTMVVLTIGPPGLIVYMIFSFLFSTVVRTN